MGVQGLAAMPIKSIKINKILNQKLIN